MRNSKKLVLRQETIKNLTVGQQEANVAATKTVPTRWYTLCNCTPVHR